MEEGKGEREVTFWKMLIKNEVTHIKVVVRLMIMEVRCQKLQSGKLIYNANKKYECKN